MRVALIITELDPGGAERCLVHLACFLKGRGHEVAVWQLQPAPAPNQRCLTDLLDQADIPWHCGDAVSAWSAARVARWLRREWIGFRPDVIQSFLFHANVAAAYAAPHTKIPVFGGVRVRQPQRWRGWLQRRASRRMHKLVCVSENVAQHCVEVEGISPAKIVVIPNGIRASQTTAAQRCWSELGLPADAPVVLFVGRLEAQKGVVEFVREADCFLENLPRHQLVLMGEGSLKPTLERTIEQAAHGERIHLAGWHAQPTDWMQIAQMLVLPARYEGMPNVVLEAMSVGTPVVSFDVDGVRELLGTSEPAEAQIVAAQDYPAFSSAIQNLAASESLRSSCSRHNRARIEQHFQLDHQLKRYLELYEAAVPPR